MRIPTYSENHAAPEYIAGYKHGASGEPLIMSVDMPTPLYVEGYNDGAADLNESIRGADADMYQIGRVTI